MTISPPSKLSMDSGIVSATTDHAPRRLAALGSTGPRPTPGAKHGRRTTFGRHGGARRRFSTLTLRILAPNVLALGVLVAGILYLDQYQGELIDAKVVALQTQGEIIAGALGEAAVTGPPEGLRIDATVGGQIVRRLVVPTAARARLFDVDGALLADSRKLLAAGREVQLKFLPPPEDQRGIMAVAARFYDWLMPRLPRSEKFPAYRERLNQRASDYPEVIGALAGDVGGAVRKAHDGTLRISVAVPVQQLRKVHGALMLTGGSEDIEESVRLVRLAIVQAFGIAFVVTILLSIFLAGTIARPVRRLAQAADRVRHWRGQRVEIPDFSNRHDEIGDLSAALGEMTVALYSRLDAIEAFAADVAHEIKNPLTSLRSAVESLALTNDAENQRQLLAVIQQDVGRLDRLISDISNASRLDAELTRTEREPIDLYLLLQTAVDIYRGRTADNPPTFELDASDADSLVVEGVPGQLGQVVDNLVSNAISFSPDGRIVRLGLHRRDGMAEITIEDDGPGIPEERAERLFERFYSHRPKGEAFGRHSGLGLSIARQIAEAHGGIVSGENRKDSTGRILGARFIVRLPL